MDAGHDQRPMLAFKHGLNTSEKLNTQTVVLRLDSRQFDGRPSGAVRPVATDSFGNGQKRTPEILCTIMKRFQWVQGDMGQPVHVMSWRNWQVRIKPLKQGLRPFFRQFLCGLGESAMAGLSQSIRP